MNWSSQQETALIRVSAWLKNGGEEPFYLAGFAGTGKTTLAKHFAEGIEGEVYFAAYTGKAALVMQRSGCIGARTIHSLIYLPSMKSFEGYEKIRDEIEDLEARTTFENEDNVAQMTKRISQLSLELAKENKELKQPTFHLNFDSDLEGAALLVVDECSMVNEEIGIDLLSFCVPILVLGDPAQLPPIRGAGYFTQRKPDYMLTEIHRQAADNPIIHLATLAREGKKISLGTYDGSTVTDVFDFEERLRADQIICGKNSTRRFYNARARVIKGLCGDMETDDPSVGDKIICLRNSASIGILNGGIWSLQNIVSGTFKHHISIRDWDNPNTNILTTALTAYFRGEEDKLSFWEEMEAEKFDYGYLITCHKAQGSQWKNLAVLDESVIFRSSRKEWLYTAITRAEEKLDLVVMS